MYGGWKIGEKSPGGLKSLSLAVDLVIHNAVSGMNLAAAQLVFFQMLADARDHWRSGDEQL